MLCRNKEVYPNTHTHQTVAESRRCWQGISPAPTPPVPASRPVTVASIAMISPRQKQYINDLGGRWEPEWTYEQASAEINRLKDQRQTHRRERVVDPRLKMIEGMIDLVPDGYYATAPDGVGGHIDFIRLSRPTRGKYNGALKIQTQHSERWENALILWPSNIWSAYKPSVIETVMLVIADKKGCARRYSIEFQSCCVCNTGLTDDRSRHYLIGPICDKKPNWQWVIDEVDEKNAGLSYEQLVARGLPTRVWQERVA